MQCISPALHSRGVRGGNVGAVTKRRILEECSLLPAIAHLSVSLRKLHSKRCVCIVRLKT